MARALVEQSTLLVVDNLESILQPPYLAADTPEVVAKDARGELATILALCERQRKPPAASAIGTECHVTACGASIPADEAVLITAQRPPDVELCGVPRERVRRPGRRAGWTAGRPGGDDDALDSRRSRAELGAAQAVAHRDGRCCALSAARRSRCWEHR